MAGPSEMTLAACEEFILDRESLPADWFVVPYEPDETFERVDFSVKCVASKTQPEVEVLSPNERIGAVFDTVAPLPKVQLTKPAVKKKRQYRRRYRHRRRR